MNRVGLILDTFAEKIRQKDGDPIGDLAAQLLAPFAERLPFIDDAPDDASEPLGRFVRHAAQMVLEDSTILDDPTRRFDELITALGIFLVEVPPAEDRKAWLDRLQQVIELVEQSGPADRQKFSQVIRELRTFRSKAARRENLMEERARKAEQARQRLQEARDSASRVVGHLLERMDAPPCIAELISGPWENVIVLVSVRSGPDSRETARAVKTAQDLIKWSKRPRPMPKALGERLVDGLAMVGFSANEAQRQFDELLAELLPPEKPRVEAERKRSEREQQAPVDVSAPPASADSTSAPSSDGLEGREPVAQTENQRPDSSKAQPIRATPRKAPRPSVPKPPSTELLLGGVSVNKGDWFEFVRSDGGRVQAKLSWINPVSNKLLFVDGRGIKVADLTFDALRNNVAKREARLIRAPGS